MRRTTIVLALVAALAPAALAQERPDRSAEVREALARLPIGPGVWEGEAWYRGGPGAPDTIRQTEHVWREDGEVSMDGSTWRPFFGMTLRRTGAAGEGR